MPDRLNYGSAGNGSVNHLLGEMLKVEADVRIAHVPYKGAPQAISDVIGGTRQGHREMGQDGQGGRDQDELACFAFFFALSPGAAADVAAPGPLCTCTSLA